MHVLILVDLLLVVLGSLEPVPHLPGGDHPVAVLVHLLNSSIVLVY